MGRQTGILPEKYQTYDWLGRTIKHHRTQIRNFFGFREATKADGQELTQWLTEQVLAYDLNIEHLTTAALIRVRQLKIEPPTLERLERITRSAIRTFEERFFANTLLQIPPATREQIDRLLNTAASSQELTDTSGNDTVLPPEVSSFSELKTDPGRIGVDSFQKEVAKLQQIRQLELPNGLFKLFSTKVLQIYKQRVTVEPPRDLRRHPDPIRYTLIAAFCWLRSQEITDNLVELLISIVHRIGARAEQRVEKELLNDFKRVGGKINLLFPLAEATLSQPDGLVKHVVFPVVSEQKLKDLVKEFKSTGSAYREKIYTVMRASYGSHYRQILPLLLNLLEFHSNNEVHRPVIQALELMKKYANSKQRYYEPEEEIPIEGVLRSGWQELVLEKNAEGLVKVNRINYELSVLQALRDGLRCKEIWVVGANRYRNPDDDLPADFEAQRQVYYQALKQPQDVEAFISTLQRQMTEALTKLDQGLPKNPAIKITNKNNGWISLSPLKAQSEPLNLARLKSEIVQRWPMTSVLDILKETDLRVGFSEQLKRGVALT